MRTPMLSDAERGTDSGSYSGSSRRRSSLLKRRVPLLFAVVAVVLFSVAAGLIGAYAHRRRSSSSTSNGGGGSSQAQDYSNQFFHESFASGPQCPNRVPWPILNELFGKNSVAVVESIMSDTAVKNAISTFDQTFTTQLVSQMKGLLKTDRPMGMSAFATLGNQIIYDGHAGFLDPLGASNAAPNIDTAYQIGSITKVFTTGSFFQHIERGVVALTDAVSKFLPDFSVTNPYSTSDVTLDSLSSQTSGLARAPLCGNYPSCSGDDIVKLMQYQELKFAPDTQATYSNLGLSLLGHSVAAAAKASSYEEMLVSEFTTPLNMSRTGFFEYPFPGRSSPATWVTGTTSSDISSNMALPHTQGSDGKLVSISPTLYSLGWNNPGGGLTSTPRDMSKFAMWILSSATNGFAKGASMLASSVSRWIGPGFDLGDGLSNYGIGAWERVYLNGTWVVTKGGLTAGAGTQLALVPELGLSVMFFMGLDSGIIPDKMGANFMSTVIPVVRQALFDHTCAYNPLPSNVADFYGKWGSGSFIVAEMSSSSGGSTSSSCEVTASMPALSFPNLGNIVITNAPGQSSIDVAAIFATLTNKTMSQDSKILWSFRYTASRTNPAPVFASYGGNVPCYLDTALGTNAVGYIVSVPDLYAGPLMYLPNSFGTQGFAKLS